ncbi:DUF7289 family protein [Halostella pelagica]|uniref:DUF7289 family protein n=1 Tax=Halostella pelagica TaxID=2583824 RepID=UPI0010819E1B|nr:hypothetical protein [Halostella pelagica]
MRDTNSAQISDDGTDRATDTMTTGGGSSVESLRDAEHAQSSVIAVVLLVGLTVTGAATVFLVGSTAISESQDDAELENAENALAQIDSKANRVAAGSNNTEEIQVTDSDAGETWVEPQAGSVNITVENETTGNVKQVLLDEELGQVVYEIDGERIAYQGGGVWRSTENSSRMLSRPDIHYEGGEQDNPTSTIPLTLIDGNRSSGDSLTISDNGTELRYPIRGNENRSNPILSGQIRLTIQSEYYLAWGDYLEQLTGGIADYDHANKEVSIVLISPRDRDSLQQGLFQTGSDTDLTIGAGGGTATVDSYNSSKATYAAQNTENGSIRTAGNVDVQSNGEVYGDIIVGSDIAIQASAATITGNVSYGGVRGNKFKAGAVDGWIANNASVNSTPTIRAYVEGRVDQFSNGTINDNNEEGWAFTSNDRLDFGNNGGDITLPSDPDGRRYYVNGDLAMSNGDNLTFDTTDGNVYVGVEDSLTMDEDANITVDGQGTVRIYILDDLTMNDQASVYVPKDNATKMWVYGTPETDVDFDGNGKSNSPEYIGAIYAPTTGDGSGGVSIDNHVEVYGGIVGGQADIQQGSIHFDEALRGVDPLPVDESIPRVTHLHLSVNRVHVEAD